MHYLVDLVKEVVLLINPQYEVVDAFQAEGRTRHLCNQAIAFYTYRSHLTLPEHCLICGKHAEEFQTACPSSGGFHAFVGLPEHNHIPSGHHAVNRSAPFVAIRFQDLEFYLERDYLFPAEEIAEALSV